jgi:phenylalanyl-tRNA synthetase beta chain
MKVPISWLKDFVAIPLPLEDLAQRLTLAGLEVEEIHFVGLPMPKGGEQQRHETKITGIEWDPEKIVVAAISEVMPHPNADRLVLCRLDDGQQEQIVLTGAPNLYPYKGKGPLQALRGGPIKVAYAKEGARIYDGHQPGQVITTLKRTKIRGVDSYSMACSEKELGISDEHEGIIFLDEDAPVGMSLVEYMGDAVFEIAITPNIARDANLWGVAREVAAITGQTLHLPSLELSMDGPPIQGRVSVEINDPQLNPRFVLGIIEGVEIRPSPYQVQRRLRLAGMRPINNIVDATNYVMLEVGQPLHAFDYDILVQRAVGRGGNSTGRSPRFLTRAALPGEGLKTLDGVERQVDDFTVMVTDQSGALALAGVMGGAESEVSEHTCNILLEGAAWNMINTRRTVLAQNLPSEAAYRFSRGVHPAMAERGVRRGLDLMGQWSGGLVAQGLVDNYPLPPTPPSIELTPADVRRWLGIQLSLDEIQRILESLEFDCEPIPSAGPRSAIRATPPDHRLDIGEGVIGLADVMEEIARIYGYDRIPETRMADELPLQRSNPILEMEERLRDLLAGLGLQEVVTYRMTSPEREQRLLGQVSDLPQEAPDPHHPPYLRLANPIASDRVVMRQSLLASVLEIVERNARLFPRQALFEIGQVFIPQAGSGLPTEPPYLVIALTGPRTEPGWQLSDAAPMDFYDLKGTVSALLEGLNVPGVHYEPGEHLARHLHPGRSARILTGETPLGTLGELHPLVRERYELPETPLLAAEIALDALYGLAPERFDITPVPAFPPVLEDLAFIVDEALPAEQVADAIRQAGGKTLIRVHLFDMYRGEQVGTGKKSLAYSLTYQAPDRTLTDQEVAQIRSRIVRRLEETLGARLRG